ENGADDTEDDIRQQAVIGLHDLFRDPTGERADDDRHDPAKTFHMPLLCPVSLRPAGQTWMTRPLASRTLSCMVSDSVGCGKTLWISSSSVVSRFIATTKPWMSSVTSAPTMCAPRSWPVFASKIVLTRPSGSPSAIA